MGSHRQIVHGHGAHEHSGGVLGFHDHLAALDRELDIALVGTGAAHFHEDIGKKSCIDQAFSNCGRGLEPHDDAGVSGTELAQGEQLVFGSARGARGWQILPFRGSYIHATEHGIRAPSFFLSRAAGLVGLEEIHSHARTGADELIEGRKGFQGFRGKMVLQGASVSLGSLLRDLEHVAQERNKKRVPSQDPSSQVHPEIRELHELVRLVIHESIACKAMQGVGHAGVGHSFSRSDIANTSHSLFLLKLQNDLEIVFETLREFSHMGMI